MRVLDNDPNHFDKLFLQRREFFNRNNAVPSIHDLKKYVCESDAIVHLFIKNNLNAFFN